MIFELNMNSINTQYSKNKNDQYYNKAYKSKV